MWPALAAALVVGAAPAPQSSRVVFTSARTGVAQLYSVSPSGSGLAQLTFDKTDWGAPLPSPDGRFVAAIHDGWLFVMRPDGRDRRLLALNAHSASWSADSHRLAVQVARGVETIAQQGGDERWMSPADYESWPSPSPHGRAVAFLRGGQLIVHRKGRNWTLVPQASGAPAWSPDGKWIATVSGSGDAVELVRPTGGTPRVVASRVGPPAYGATLAWSPRGRRLAYADLDGIHLVSPAGGDARLLVAGPSGPLAWAPGGGAIAFGRGGGPTLVTTDGDVRTIVAAAGVTGAGWTAVRPGDRYRTPQPVQPGTPLVEVSQNELRARVPIRAISAEGDRVAYWLCPHVFGAWRPRPGEAPVALGPSTLEACAVPSDPLAPGSFVYDLALAGDRLAYLTRSGSNTSVWHLMLTTFERGDEGVEIAAGGQTCCVDPRWAQLEDLVAGGGTLVFGERGLSVLDWRPPESIWRLDRARPVLVARRADDLQPLSVEVDLLVARRADGGVDLLDTDGHLIETFDGPALGAALGGDDLVVLVQGELRDYSISQRELRAAWPLPDVPSSGRCRVTACPGIRLTLDDTARGLALYTLDGTVHLIRLRDGHDEVVLGATVAELTDAGLFYAYSGETPWPGRIRFVPFDELPLR